VTWAAKAAKMGYKWKVVNGKVLTRVNLAKLRHVEDKTCLFCNEAETPIHVFYDCCVAKLLWERVLKVTDLPLISFFDDVAKCWLKRNRYAAFNVLTIADVWILWKTRNNLCFQGHCWSKVEVLLGVYARMIKNWRLLSKEEEMVKLESGVQELERRSAKPPLLGWRSHPISGSLPTDEALSRETMVDDMHILDSAMLSLLRDGVVPAQVETELNYTLLWLFFNKNLGSPLVGKNKRLLLSLSVSLVPSEEQKYIVLPR
jgi:hypothetical protein